MRYRFTVTGVVQGVGFRPFVKRLAERLGASGCVWNTGGGVIIEVEGVDAPEFSHALRAEAPPAARIASCTVEELPAVPYTAFDIVASELAIGTFTLISPDLATCPDCLREVLDPNDRRYRYPFTNCTNCGPRYSITRAVPYDRANTTMDRFTLCECCRAEYVDTADRRFHAEPNACPRCGPRLDPDLDLAVEALRGGQVVAVKSVGGYQLACDACNTAAVSRLRAAKRRGRKPFAVMARDLAVGARYCTLTDRDRTLLQSPAAPIVLLPLREGAGLPADLAPGLRELGVMLPYTPLHHLLLAGGPDLLVMTSGNISDEPIVIANDEARRVLGPLCDLLLTHDRDIFMRVDDSVVRGDSILRRARGYAPEAIDLGTPGAEVLAVGGELKNAFCLTKGRYAILSQHIGDLENWETLTFFEEALRNLQAVYRAEPRLVVHDLHPDYLGTRWALRRPGPHLAVQHHHAHIASVMAEHGLREPVLGVAFDGAGYGVDGQIWGGEFLLCDGLGFKRAAHLRYVPQPGGDRTAREPARMAAAFLWDAYGTGWRGVDLGLPERVWHVLEQLCERADTPRTSSCGRLFDAVAALAGVCRSWSYEGEAAMLLEAAAATTEEAAYPFALEGDEVDTRPLIRAVCADVCSGLPAARIAARFHTALADIILAVCEGLCTRTGVRKVCMSGGTFQNVTLATRARRLMEGRGISVFTQHRVPANDGGLALGQAWLGRLALERSSRR